MKGKQIRNPKSEIRNKFQSLNPKSETVVPFEFWIWNFIFRICFGFRISDFEFNLTEVSHVRSP